MQGMITLWDCDEGDSTLCVHEGSNTIHKAFGEHFSITQKNDWYKVNGEEQ